LLIGFDGVHALAVRRAVRALRRICRLIGPTILVEERRRIAPRPIVGFRGIAPKADEDGFEVGALKGLDESLFGVPPPDAVRKDGPEVGEANGGRAPFRGRRGYRGIGVRKGGVGGNLRGKGVTRDKRCNA